MEVLKKLVVKNPVWEVETGKQRASWDTHWNVFVNLLAHKVAFCPATVIGATFTWLVALP